MDTATTSLLGRCKDCDYTIFATRDDVKQADTPKDVLAGQGVFRLNNGYVARCTSRHRFFQVKAIKGTYSEKHKCDARCLNAKGWECTCSCGGANHGRGHAVTIVNAAELPAKTGEAKHLGEVGKTIRGEVRTGPVRHLSNGTALYTFFTVNGGHVIKWFAAPHFDPQWTEGSTRVIRAKVKSHDEFQGVPETRVIYVEEVE